MEQPTTTENGPELGEMKWFGGFNNTTGRENDYGFISAKGGELFVHRSQSLSSPEYLTPGAKVIFVREVGKNGKTQARSVRVLSLMDDSELLPFLRVFPPEDVVAEIISRDKLEAFEEEVLRALSILSKSDTSRSDLAQFWRKFPPSSPKSPFFSYAPHELKIKICKVYYSEFRARLNSIFSSVAEAETSLQAEVIYKELGQKDEKIALAWAGRDDLDGLLAKMLSARAAELAAKRFYEKAGSSVQDVSIGQLDDGAVDWVTHDLLVDAAVPVDVKNARRPINAKKFYVEHTVPRFKLDRKSVHVRISGILSPYLSLSYIRDPDSAQFKIDEIIFLGETSRDSIDRLGSLFNSPSFEVARPNERIWPNWVFDYPKSWYRALFESIDRFTKGCDWPEGVEWEYTLSSSEKIQAIPALCVAGKTLPIEISSELADWQKRFYEKLQILSDERLSLPAIFITVLTDFLEKLRGNFENFAPAQYKPLLFADDHTSGSLSHPLGTIDPLGIVNDLIATLGVLWENRENAHLGQLTNFRFSGLGILQGREEGSGRWKTIIAYCGGSIYETDTEDNILIDSSGKPRSLKGKCGKTPLIIGREPNRSKCGKLVCSKCGFCSAPCQERRFVEIADAAKAQAEKAKSKNEIENHDPAWELIPIEVYEKDFRR